MTHPSFLLLPLEPFLESNMTPRSQARHRKEPCSICSLAILHTHIEVHRCRSSEIESELIDRRSGLDDMSSPSAFVAGSPRIDTAVDGSKDQLSRLGTLMTVLEGREGFTVVVPAV